MWSQGHFSVHRHFFFFLQWISSFLYMYCTCFGVFLERETIEIRRPVHKCKKRHFTNWRFFFLRMHFHGFDSRTRMKPKNKNEQRRTIGKNDMTAFINNSMTSLPSCELPNVLIAIELQHVIECELTITFYPTLLPLPNPPFHSAPCSSDSSRAQHQYHPPPPDRPAPWSRAPRWACARRGYKRYTAVRAWDRY